jgi:hypothetical protein
MRPAHELAGPERQTVHRLFTIRWMPGCVNTRLHGPVGDDEDTRAQIAAWAGMLREITPKLGPRYVSLIDASASGGLPRSSWLELIQLTRAMTVSPVRRVLLTAEGRLGDHQAETAQLVTAGNVRVFGPDQLDAAIAWLAEAEIVDAIALAEFLR